MNIAAPVTNPASAYSRKVFVLQGGGALGSYQAGAFQALREQNIEPDWIAGISIGAINASIMAGNVPGERLKALSSFWNKVTVHLPSIC